jgi:hypothetical protein
LLHAPRWTASRTARHRWTGLSEAERFDAFDSAIQGDTRHRPGMPATRLAASTKSEEKVNRLAMKSKNGDTKRVDFVLLLIRFYWS